MGTSVRLNQESRKDIISNIQKAYELKNPAPVVSSLAVSNVGMVIYAIYIERYKELIKLYKKGGMYSECINTKTYFQYKDKHGNWENIYFNTIPTLTNKKDPHAYVWQPLGKGALLDLSNDDWKTDYPDSVEAIAEAEVKDKAFRRKVKQEKQAYSEWESILGRYMADVTNVVSGCNTTGQLLELWPEVGCFLPTGLSAPNKIALPAVSIAELNSKI